MKHHEDAKSDFAKKLRAAWAAKPQAPEEERAHPMSSSERADRLSQRVPIVPSDRALHGIPANKVVDSVDELLSLSIAVTTRPRVEEEDFFTYLRALNERIEQSYARIRVARRDAWMEMFGRGAKVRTAEAPNRAVVAGVVLQGDSESLHQLVSGWLASGELVERFSQRQSHAGDRRDPVLRALWNEIAQTPTDCSLRPVVLDDEDVRLALGWSTADVRSIVAARGEALRGMLRGLATGESRTRFNEVHRCLAARHAEVLAANVLRGWQCAVEDVSRLAVAGGGDTRWLTHDLQVDGEPVDVKNVTYNRADLQTWHRARHFRKSVRYDAVRTRSMASLLSFLGEGEAVDAEYLGSLRPQELAELERMAEPGLSITLSKIDEQEAHRLATWCFSLPDAAYRTSDGKFAQLNRRLAESRASRFAEPVGYSAVLRAMGHEDLLSEAERENLDREYSLSRLARSVERHGRKPGVIIVALMNELVRHLRGEASLSEPLSRQLRVLAAARPLGVYDPSASVHRFLTALLALVRSPESLAGIEKIELVGTRWIRGTNAMGERLTLITNCRECGEFPLIRGQNDGCDHGTGRLKCRANGHCC